MRFITSALVALTIGLMTPIAAQAQKLSLNEISSYLNGISTAKGEFTQINDDGSISTGTIYIKRPGRVRFEYNPPESALVVAGSNTVVIYDKKSNQPAETYPLSKTPLSIILDRSVNLGRAQMVTGHTYDGTATIVTAQDPAHPEYGNIRLKFTGNPVELRQWVIRDGNGTTTTVVLGDLQKGVNMPNSLFDVGSPGSAPRQ
ncbi:MULTISPECIES: LolA family protein [unclassified Sulfitobacter]|uniref:LolA family protein n=1 Tax=unclassified Sulfitobacter TaxID=196795 RepID=UPI0007C30D26|nr:MULTISPECIES: outer membrane lipoprotein carrier protein LolA [unclassified Sulfitobacter]KZX99709.1 cell envelope biogenesis protein LolA [Sulfitobacter sp. HI0023]KZY27476.1 cell envelope biogenesis protein LolA [Sulfitobacter sp. HI0040]KZZ68942.1 cell envelope biogenesis protein LolA [Sulfitobacter sp. HI0129]